MSTTTPGAIRDVIIARIASLTPPAPVTPRFVAHRSELATVPLRRWASTKPGACMRRFDVVRVAGPRPVEVTNGIAEHVRVDFEIVIAYAADQRFADQRSLDDVIIADLAHVIKYAGTLGFSVTPTSNATIVDGEQRTEEGDGVIFGVVPLNDIAYWRNVA